MDAKTRQFPEFKTVIADGVVCGVIPKSRKKELKRFDRYHGIDIRPATFEEMRKYWPDKLDSILEKEAENQSA